MKSKLQELEKKVEFYEYILDNVHAGVWVNEIDKCLWANSFATTQMTGRKVEELNSYNRDDYARKFYHPDDIQIFKESVEHLLKGNTHSATAIYREKHKNGEWKKILLTCKISKWDKNEMPIETVCCGIVISDELADFTKVESLLKENAQLRNELKLAELTKREEEIIKYISKGLSSKEIANKENISFHTVESHRKNILRKLELKNTPDLVRFATECGLY